MAAIAELPPQAVVTEEALASRRGWRLLRGRLGFYLFTAWAAGTLNFVIPRLLPGSPAAIALENLRKAGITPSPAEVVALHRFYGNPNSNLLSQYLDYWNGLVHWNFGVSTSHFPVPVGTLVLRALPWTLGLVGVTTIVAWMIGTLLGIVLGWRPGNRLDGVAIPLTTFVNAIPAFWLSLVAAWFFAFKLHWFPLGYAYSPNVRPGLSLRFMLSVLYYGALPGLTLIFLGVTFWLFSMRNMMVTTVSEDYVQLGKAKGLSRWQVMTRYAARNAMLPNITNLAIAIGGIIAGVLITEIVFTYPGIGNLLYEAIQAQDFPLMQAIFLVITLVTVGMNFVADSLYAALDPRTRAN